MTGPEHFLEAQQFADASVYAYQKWAESGAKDDLESARWQQAQGQVHALLAVAAAVALGPHFPHDMRAWRDVAGVQPEPAGVTR